MATEATIGALRVVLGAEIAKFQSNLEKADASLGAFGRSVAKIAAGIQLQQTLENAVRGIISAVTKAIDSAEKLGATAKQIGIPVEELSKLQFAAKQSEVNVETLSIAVVRLSRNMSEIAGGKTTGAAAEAFIAMGVSVTDASGRLKETDAILLELATKFAGYSDGAAKSALATALFGRSGAELLPLLDKGAVGITKLTKEAERLGIVVTQETSDAADQFNDNLQKLSEQSEAAARNIFNRLAPALIFLTGKLVEVSAEGSIFNTWLSRVAGIFLRVIPGVGQLVEAYNLYIAATKAARDSTVDYDEVLTELAKTFGLLAQIQVRAPAPVLVDQEALKKQRESALEAMKAIEQEQLAIMERFRTPAEEMVLEIQKINDAFARGILTQEQYGFVTERIMQRVRDSVADSAADIAGSISGLLGTFGEKNKQLGIAAKAFAVSQAIINTYLGATKALATTPLPPPAPQIAAAAVIAAGLASVAKIVAQPGFATGGSFKVGGSGSTDSKLVQFMATPGEMVDVRRPGMTGQASEITVSGIRPRDFFTGDMLREMVSSLNAAHADGYKLKFAEG